MFFFQLLLRVLRTETEQQPAIRCEHDGLGTSLESKCMSGHRGITAMTDVLNRKFYWRSMDADIRQYCKQCMMCQKVNPKCKQEKPPLQNVSVPKSVMQQTGVDIASLPECHGYNYFILAIDYFSKWTKGEPLKDKTPASVANFIFKICRHSCVKIQNQRPRKRICKLCVYRVASP